MSREELLKTAILLAALVAIGAITVIWWLLAPLLALN